MVTAKFKVSRKTEMNWATEVELTPDYADGRNKEWAEATPAGMIRLTVKNDVASEQFVEGKAYTVKFEEEEVGVEESSSTVSTPPASGSH